jgi:hypothetical protein
MDGFAPLVGMMAMTSLTDATQFEEAKASQSEGGSSFKLI